jgi:hypothetical protein
MPMAGFIVSIEIVAQCGVCHGNRKKSYYHCKIVTGQDGSIGRQNAGVSLLEFCPVRDYFGI